MGWKTGGDAAVRVVILHDEVPPTARPDELDTLIQAECVARALGEFGHKPVRLPLTLDLRQAVAHLREMRPDCVFNLVESVGGQGRLIHLAPALLDSLDLPYTGAHTQPMFITSNKTLCKQMLAAHGIATPGWFTPASLAAHAGPLAGRYIIKSVWEEASVGLEDDSVCDCRRPAELLAEMVARRERLGGTVFAERYVEGREFNLSLISPGAREMSGRPRVLCPAEIRFVNYPADKPRIVGYSAKWRQDSHEYQHTPRTFEFADRDRGLLADLIRVAERCWQVLGLRGYARVDFRVDGDGRSWVLEVNANPCLSPESGFVAAARRSGLAFAAVIEHLLADAVLGSCD